MSSIQRPRTTRSGRRVSRRGFAVAAVITSISLVLSGLVIAAPVSAVAPGEDPIAVTTPLDAPVDPPTDPAAGDPTPVDPPAGDPTPVDPPTDPTTDEPTPVDPPTDPTTDEPTPVDPPTDPTTDEPTAEPCPTASGTAGAASDAPADCIDPPKDKPKDKPTPEPCPTASETASGAAGSASDAPADCIDPSAPAKPVLADVEIATDKSEYKGGSDVTITGGDWTGDDSVSVVVTNAETDAVVHEAEAAPSKSGDISVTFTLPKKYIANLKVVATGADTDRSATGAFTEILAKASISSEFADYAPGALVRLSGAGWVGDEKVKITINDTVGQTWQRFATVSVDGAGIILDEFPLPTYFISDYDVTAVGLDTGRIATAAFTDGLATITVRKAGARQTSDGTVQGLSGVVFKAYQVADDQTTTIPNPLPQTVYTCTTVADGTCSMSVGWTGQNNSARFLVVEDSAPGTWSMLPSLSPGDYRFNVGVTNGNTTLVPSGSRYWANRAANPAWPGFCGLNVAILFDESTSIDDGEWTQMKTAAADFVRSLETTPSRVAQFSFSTSAIASKYVALAPATDALANSIDGLNVPGDGKSQEGGYTNWDRGLFQIAQKSAVTGDHYDVVLVLTDGDPTVYGSESSGSVRLQTVEEAVHSSNAIKALNTRVVGVGIGLTGNSIRNLQAISGPTAQSDYFLAADFAALKTKLAEIAAAQCGGTVTVNKFVGETVQTGVRTNNWAFSAVPSNGGTSTPSSGSTGTVNATNGIVQFKLTGPNWPMNVTVTETTAGQNGFYLKSATCTVGNQTYSNAPGTNYVVIQGVQKSDSPTCTFLNAPSTGSIELQKQWAGPGTGGQTTLRIGTSIGGTEVDSQQTGSAGQGPLTTGANTVPSGVTYYLSETGGLGDYSQVLTCLKNGQNLVPGANGSVVVDTNDTVVCKWTNTRRSGSIELQKQWAGPGTGGQTTLRIGTSIGGTEVDSQQTGSAGQGPLTTGANTVPSGVTYYLSETGGLGDYSQVLTCLKNGQNLVPGANGSVVVDTNDTVVCKWTNTRRSGSIELQKQWAGPGTGGQTTLRIGTSIGGTEVDSQQTGSAGQGPLTTGANTVPSGVTYYLSETGGLGDYSQVLTCLKNGQNLVPGANGSVVVDTNDTVVCKWTNTRRSGSIELQKQWAGPGTGGQTTLRIGTSIGGTEVDSQQTGSAGQGPLTTGANTVPSGVTYYLSETGGLGDYSQVLTCLKNGQNLVPGANGSVVVDTNDTVVCKWTNTRRSGSIELQKQWAGPGTGGQTTLRIGTSIGGTEVDSQQTGSAGQGPLTTGANTVPSGVTYYLSETGGLGDYSQVLTCLKNGQNLVPGANGSVVVDTNDTVVCKWTNTRRSGSIELQKQWAGPGTGGQTTLRIGTSIGGTEVDSQQTGSAGQGPLTTGANTVPSGVTYYLSETGGLGDYSQVLTCLKNGQNLVPGANGSVVVDTNDTVVCKWTNTRRSGSIELQKQWAGPGTGGQTTLRIGTSIGGTEVDSQQTGSAGQGPLTTGANTVPSGVTYYLSETGGLGDYSQVLTCLKNGQNLVPGANGSVVVDTNDTVVCKWTNTRQTGSIELQKQWTGTKGNVTLKIGTQAGLSDVASTLLSGADGTTGVKTVASGNYYVAETVTNDGDYDTVLSCTRNGENITPLTQPINVAKDDAVVCKYVNTRKQGTIEVVKYFVNAPQGAAVDLQIGGVTKKAGATDGQSTGAVAVDTGAYSVGELGTLSAPLSSYDSTIVCKVGEKTVASGDGSTLARVPVEKGENVVCSITNTRKLGSLVVTKVVDWNDTTPIDKQTFEICIEGPSFPEGACKTFTYRTGEGESDLINSWSDLLPGPYTVTETTVSGPGGISSWTVELPLNVEVPEGGGVEGATVKNTRDIGEFTVTKTLTGGPSGFTGPFPITYLCTLEGVDDLTGKKSLEAGETWEVTGIPTGYECSVTEELPGAPGGYTWSTPIISDNEVPTTDGIVMIYKPVTPTAEEVDVAPFVPAITVANKLTQNPPPPSSSSGALSITKTLSGGTGSFAGSFEVQYSCTNGGPSGTVSLAAGATETVYNVPNGSQCTVTEPNLPEPPTGFAWAPPQISGSGGTVSNGSTIGVTVANALNTTAVSAALPATIPQETPTLITAPAPATVGVPAAATIPTAVPAGGGYDGPRRDVPLSVLILMFVGLMGAVAAVAGRQLLGKG